MKFLTHRSRSTGLAFFSKPVVGALLLATLLPLSLVLITSAGATALGNPLLSTGTLRGYAVLANQAISNTGTTTITGSVGLSPGASIPASNSITGFSTATINGNPYAGNSAVHAGDIGPGSAAQAQLDWTTANTDAAGEVPPSATSATTLGVGGQTLTAGIYKASSSIDIPTNDTLTLDGGITGGGVSNAVFVFQTGGASTLTVNVGSSVVLTGGAQACNVFWQIGSSATLNGNQFVGTVLATDSISTTGSTSPNQVINGRLLASTGSVTLANDTINAPSCAAIPSAPTPTSTTCTIASATNTATAGQSVNFTANVSGANPTGTVTFFDGTNSLGSGTLNAAGQATLSTSALGTGSNAITAQYSGDGANTACQSVAFSFMVSASLTTTTVLPASTVVPITSPAVTPPTVGKAGASGITASGKKTATGTASATGSNGATNSSSSTTTLPIAPTSVITNVAVPVTG